MTLDLMKEGPVSMEIRAGFKCPHFVVEEPVLLAEDRLSLMVSAPIANAGSVQILVNNQVYIPASGLDSQARMKSTLTGPFNIPDCTGSNLLEITTGEGSKVVVIPTGPRVPLKEVLRALRLGQELVGVNSDETGIELVELQTAGPESFIRLSGGALGSLGFSQSGCRGSHVYPGWGMETRDDVYPIIREGAPARPARFPKFNSPLKGNPSIKVSYVAVADRCPRCGGTWVENDWRFSPDGEVITITNEDLLYQACLKAILTVKGSNPFHRGYGSSVSNRIGSKAVGAAANLIREDVTAALKQVQHLQQGQRKYQPVSNKETLYAIQNVDARVSESDPTLVFLDVTVRNASNEPITISTSVYAVPGSVALAGTNGQTLGLETTGSNSRDINRFLGR